MANESEGVFSTSRLRLARFFAGLSHEELAERVSVTRQFVAQIEQGKKRPSLTLAAALSDALDFETSFFYGPPVEEFLEYECHFRRRRSTPVAVKRRALSHGTLFGDLVRYLDNSLELPSVNVPRIKVQSVEDIEKATERCRLQWELGLDRPITNTIRALENAGVVCTFFSGASAKIDAFSRARRGARPVVVLSDAKGSTSRTRFDVAHECGHLVMHEDVTTGDVETEAQADYFGSALLLPRAGFIRHFPRTVDWPTLFSLKRHWGASVAAIVRRAYDLKLISAGEYRKAYKRISYQGWHKGEPEEPPKEQPETVDLCMAELTRGSKIAPREVASHLGWKAPTFTNVTGIRIQSSDGLRLANVVRLMPRGLPVT